MLVKPAVAVSPGLRILCPQLTGKIFPNERMGIEKRLLDALGGESGRLPLVVGNKSTVAKRRDGNVPVLLIETHQRFPAKSRQTTLIDRTIQETHQTQHGERAQTVFARVCEPFLVGRHGLESMPALNLGVLFLKSTRSRRRMSPRCALAR